MRSNKPFIVLLIILSVFLCSCGTKQEIEEEDVPELINSEIEHEMEFGGVYVKISIDDFNNLGFRYGDSVNVEFDNGQSLIDIPYYNGYYVDALEPLLIAYPGYDYIKVGINYGSDLWDDFNLKLDPDTKTLWQRAELEEHNKATITLNEAGKYRDIQEASDIHYYDERERYESDEEFANFRSMNVGQLKDNIIYRSASPCDNQHQRAPYVDRLIKEAGIRTILDLADNYNKIEKYIAEEGFASDHFSALYDDNQVIAIALNMNYLSDDFGMKIVQGFNEMALREGPYLIHCTEGKDRTGFVAMLIEAMAGASYEEIRDDYMLTYDNYYKINETKDKAKYDTILQKNLDAMIRSMVNDESVDFKNTDLSVYAKNYLLRMGMTEEEYETFRSRLIR